MVSALRRMRWCSRSLTVSNFTAGRDWWSARKLTDVCLWRRSGSFGSARAYRRGAVLAEWGAGGCWGGLVLRAIGRGDPCQPLGAEKVAAGVR